MRLLGITAIMILASGCTTAGSTEGPVEVRNVANAAFASSDTPGATLVRDEATYRKTWTARIAADQPAPAVDFAQEQVVFLLAGSRPTGGYSISVKGATIENGVLVVDASIDGPPAGAIVTQVITSPYAVIAVKDRTASEVRWPALR